MEIVGFGFRPTEEELVNFYLKHKLLGDDPRVDVMTVIDLLKVEPWEIPAMLAESVIQFKGPEWFFFRRVRFKYQNSKRNDRKTKCGYWKPTGKDRKVRTWATNTVIGTKKTLVFQSPSKGVQAKWVIHEYHAGPGTFNENQRNFVLCRLIKKPGKTTEKGIGARISDEGESSGSTVSDYENQAMAEGVASGGTSTGMETFCRATPQTEKYTSPVEQSLTDVGQDDASFPNYPLNSICFRNENNIHQVSSETTQVSSETTKVSSETTKVSSETTKVSSETTQVSSETTQVSSETTQVPSEVPSKTTQVPSETTQVPSEFPSETTQVPSETTQVPSETTQVPSETTQVPSEFPSETTQVPSKTTQVPSEFPSETTQVPSKTTQVPSEFPSETTQVPSKTTQVSSEFPSETMQVPFKTTQVPFEFPSETMQVSSQTTQVASETTQEEDEQLNSVFESLLVGLKDINSFLDSSNESKSMKRAYGESSYIDEVVPKLDDSIEDISTTYNEYPNSDEYRLAKRFKTSYDVEQDDIFLLSSYQAERESIFQDDFWEVETSWLLYNKYKYMFEDQLY